MRTTHAEREHSTNSAGGSLPGTPEGETPAGQRERIELVEPDTPEELMTVGERVRRGIAALPVLRRLAAA